MQETGGDVKWCALDAGSLTLFLEHRATGVYGEVPIQGQEQTTSGVTPSGRPCTWSQTLRQTHVFTSYCSMQKDVSMNAHTCALHADCGTLDKKASFAHMSGQGDN